MNVDTEKLHEQALQLRLIERELQSIQENVHDIIGRLSREVTGEKVRDPLKRIAMTIEKRGNEVRTLSGALDQISRVYEECEKRIVDETENADIRFTIGRGGPFPIERISIIPGVRIDQLVMPLDWTPWNT